jgi:hypothetical protein
MSGNPQPPPGAAAPHLPQYPPQAAAPPHSQTTALPYTPVATSTSYPQGTPPVEQSYQEKLPLQQPEYQQPQAQYIQQLQGQKVEQQPQGQYVQQQQLQGQNVQQQPQVWHQPMAQPGMSIRGGGGNRNVKNLPMGPNGREWSHGLFSCCDKPSTCQCCSLCSPPLTVSHCSKFLYPPTGLFAWLCPCIAYGQNKHRFDYLITYGTPDPTKGGDMVSGDCMLMCGVSCISSCVFIYLGWLLPVSCSVSQWIGGIVNST